MNQSNSNLSQYIKDQEKNGINTRAFSYKQFKQISALNPSSISPNRLFPDVNTDKKAKKDMIQSLLKYNSNNRPRDNKKLRQIELELSKKYMKKARSEAKLDIIIESQSTYNQKGNYHSRQDSVSKLPAKLGKLNSPYTTMQGSTFYEKLHQEIKGNFMMPGKNQFYAQKRAAFGAMMRSSSNGVNNSAMISIKHQNGNQSTSMINCDPTDKMKKFIQDQSSVKKSYQKFGIYPPSPVVYRNQAGLSNHSQMKRYENIISSFQQLALRLDFNKNMLSGQRPILRTFNDLHNLTVPVKQGDSILDNEEKIIQYVMSKKFHEVNDQVRVLNSLQEHYEYAIYGKVEQKSQLNISQSMSKLADVSITSARLKKPSPIQQKEGFGVALINEQNGAIDVQTLHTFELGMLLKDILLYMNIVANAKGLNIDNEPKVHQFVQVNGGEGGEGQGKWIIHDQVSVEFKFDQSTMYAIGCLPTAAV